MPSAPRRRRSTVPFLMVLLLSLCAVAPAVEASGRTVFGELFSVDG